MYSQVKPFLLYTISSLHVGSGSKIGLVDLPIQREKHTGYPKIESSSLKGATRSTVSNYLERNTAQKEKVEKVVEQTKFNLVFGSDLDEAKESNDQGPTIASAIGLADARLLLFPVRSMRGVFAYVTCPHVIKRWNQECAAYLGSDGSAFRLDVPKANTVSSRSLLVGELVSSKETDETKGNVVLEEYTWEVTMQENTTNLAKQIETWMGTPNLEAGHVVDRLVVLEDEDFVDFVTLSTETNARIRISEKTGTVEQAALWYEENVPPETIFYSFLFSGQARVDVEKFKNFKDDQGAVDVKNAIEEMKSAEKVEQFVVTNLQSVYQIGGNRTLGQGMMRHVWLNGGTN